MNTQYIKYCPMCNTQVTLQHHINGGSMIGYCIKCGRIKYKELKSKDDIKRKQREKKLERILKL